MHLGADEVAVVGSGGDVGCVRCLTVGKLFFVDDERCRIVAALPHVAVEEVVEELKIKAPILENSDWRSRFLDYSCYCGGRKKLLFEYFKV